jgi:hypothetical protein
VSSSKCRPRRVVKEKDNDLKAPAVLVASIFIAAPIPEPLSAAEAPSNVPATLPHPAAQTMLTRQYQEGEIVFYRMAASNRDRFRTTTYRADATGTVKKEASGRFVEEFTWSNFVFDDKPLDLPAAKDFDSCFREVRAILCQYRICGPC